MSVKDYEITLEGLTELKEALERGDKKSFVDNFRRYKLKLHNCSIGNSFLQQAVEKVYADAIQRFIVEV